MKKVTFIILFFASIFFAAYSQDTTRYFTDISERPVQKNKAYYEVVVFKRDMNDALWLREIYYVNTNPQKVRSKGQCKDSTGFIKQGKYIWYHNTGTKFIEESYNDGKRTGEYLSWTSKGSPYKKFNFDNGMMVNKNISWYEKGNIYDSFMLDKNGKGYGTGYYENGRLRYAGNFDNGFKNGEWKYYFDEAGNKESMNINFKGDSVITINCFDVNGSPRQTDCVQEKEAEFSGGSLEWIRYISNRLSKFESGKYIEGKKYQVIIKFIIDEDGNVKDAEVENPRIKKLDEEALKIINYSRKWKPGILYGQRIKSYRRQPILFVVEK